LFNGGNVNVALQMAPTLPAQADAPWPAPQVTTGCTGHAQTQSFPHGDVTASPHEPTAPTPWLDIQRLAFYDGARPCVELQLGASVRPDMRIYFGRTSGAGPGGEAIELVLGAGRQEFSVSGLDYAQPHPDGWAEHRRTLVFYPDGSITFDAIRHFTVCVTSTAMWEPYLKPSGVRGDAYPHYAAPC
jgi:hypothetical protein